MSRDTHQINLLATQGTAMIWVCEESCGGLDWIGRDYWRYVDGCGVETARVNESKVHLGKRHTRKGPLFRASGIG